MKKLISIFILVLPATKMLAQQPKKAGTISVKSQPVLLTQNILDASLGYKRAAIKFVPITPDYSKGYKDDKVYEWTDSTGTKHSAKGKEILDELNKFEAALNKRGHSLREKNALDGLTVNLARTNKNVFTTCKVSNKMTGISSNAMKINQYANFNTVGYRYSGMNVNAYLVGIYISSGEFKNLTLISEQSLTKHNNDLWALISLNLPKPLLDAANNCVIELAEEINGKPVLTANINPQHPGSIVDPKNQNLPLSINNTPIDLKSLPDNYTLNNYNIVFTNGASVVPLEAYNAKKYYATLKFYNASGALIKTTQPNQLVFNNQLPMPINMPVTNTTIYNGYDYDFTDPGLHCFGFYSKSKGITANYSYQGIGYSGFTKQSSVNADMHVGVKYYNWEHLVNSSAPLYNELDLFGYSVNSKESHSKPDSKFPPIRDPKAKDFKPRDPDNGILTLMGESYNLNTSTQNSFSQNIQISIADIRFFIGPVPCRITVSASGNVSINASYESNNDGSIHTTINPHADISMEGTGGVDALIVYAKIVANIDLLHIDMPCNINVDNDSKKGNISESLKVGGLDGKVYFEAGVCIPIPIFDDICESFRIDILNWDGYEKDFKVDPGTGIKL